jgi:PncC family amidohydrolase
MLDTAALAPLLPPLAAALGARGLRLATAESCTGGLIAAACTALPGSSTWFERGFVTYSNAAKTELLGVPAALIGAHGAVSEAVARAMAAGALARSDADLALAVTGIAGPDGAVPGKPVGTVWLAWARRGGAVGARRLQLAGDRAAVRAGSVAAALAQALAMLQAPPAVAGTIDGPAQAEETATMSEGVDFTKMVPGFDFLQNLVRSAGAAAPAVGQWVAPTLDPDEIGKRIDELRTVQFWLEQNARLLATTIQALEVQRMTLSTLKTMNVRLTDLRDALTLRPPEPAAPAPAPAPAPAAARPPAAAPGPAAAAAPAPAPAGAEAAAAGVEPMQWWGALTRQFTEIAANALRETSAAAAATVAPAPAPVAAPAAPRSRAARKPAARQPAAKTAATQPAPAKAARRGAAG